MAQQRDRRQPGLGDRPHSWEGARRKEASTGGLEEPVREGAPAAPGALQFLETLAQDDESCKRLQCSQQGFPQRPINSAMEISGLTGSFWAPSPPFAVPTSPKL